MAPRLDLQALLVSLLGSSNVYFQPPRGLEMVYPCVVYERIAIHVNYADNSPYRRMKRYAVTYIDRDPDSDIPDKIGELPFCAFNRHFAADDLNHDVFDLYF